MGRRELPSAKETHKYQKGSRIVCPNPKCNEPIGLLKKDLKIGDTLMASDIKYYGREYKSKERSECKKCGSMWAMRTSRGSLLFVNNGWVGLSSKTAPKIVTMPKPAIIIPKK